MIAATKKSNIIRYIYLPVRVATGGNVSVDVVASSYQVGSQTIVQLNVRDISEQKRAALKLRESGERFHLFVESVRDYALFQLDPNGLILSANSGAERLLGWRESEVIGRHFEIRFPPEDVARGDPERELETARSAGRAADEHWHTRKDGSRFFATGVLTRVWDGAPARVRENHARHDRS